MDIKRISPYPDHCTVTLDIPWDVAEALVSAGPSLISSLRDVVKQHKQSVDADEKLNTYRDHKADTPQQEWQAMAEPADIEIRLLMSEGDLSFPQTISKTAKKYGFPPSSMRALIESYRRSRKEEVAKSRTTEVIRLYFKSLSDNEIGKRVNLSTRNVQRILAEHKDIIQFARNQINITDKAEAKKETREERKTRFLRRNAEIVEQHLQGVSEHQLARSFKLAVLTIRKILKTCKTTTSELDRERILECRKANHKRISIQLYRQYRRIRPHNQNSLTVYKDLAKQFSQAYGDGGEIPTFYVEHLIQARRRMVTAYVKNRRIKTIIRLKAKKRNNSDIATAIGIHEKTVARIFREHKASLIRGEAS